MSGSRYADEIERTIDGESWSGELFCDSREECKALAASLRKQGLRARAIHIPATKGIGYVGSSILERFVLLLPRVLSESEQETFEKYLPIGLNKDD